MAVLGALAVWCLCLKAAAQNEIEAPARIRVLQEGDLGLIDDLQIDGLGSSTSISVSNVNGVKTTKIRAGLARMELTEDPASGVTCKLTKVYGPEDLKKLEDEQPELFMHLSAIPKTIGESEIEINVGVTTTYHAADMDELKAKHPEVYEQFEKYVGQGDSERLGGLRFLRPLRLRVGPEGGGIEVFGGAEVEVMPEDDEPMSDDADESNEEDDGGGR
jgi:hypothetical protein